MKAVFAAERDLPAAVFPLRAGEHGVVEQFDSGFLKFPVAERGEYDRIDRNLKVPEVLHVEFREIGDGGVADFIPVRFFESIGYKRNLIVLTQPKDFVKKKNKMLPAIRARYLRYPAFVEAVADRHERYNETLEHVAMLEQTGQAFVIRPPIPLEIGSMERDPAQLRRVYDTGRAVAEIQVDKIAAFVEQSRAAE